MSSRKRKDRAIQGPEGKLSKRAKLLSDLWQSKDGGLSDSGADQSNLSSPVYRIRSIIGERTTEYLIDWADDPITGESFDPDWQPKTNVNSAAVETWKRKRICSSSNNFTKHKNQRRWEKGPNQIRNNTTSSTSDDKQGRQIQYISETTSQRSSSSVIQRQNIIPEAHLPPGKRDFPAIAVQVSQHSSLSENHHIAYRSSASSTGELLSILSAHQAPASSVSPQKTNTSQPWTSQGNSVVPDSQSLPGSSSYIPTSGTSTDDSPGGLLNNPRTSLPSNPVSSITTFAGLDNASPLNFEVAATEISTTDSQLSQIILTQRSGEVLQSFIQPPSLSRCRNVVPDDFEISDDNTHSHPSQATTTDGSVLSLKDPNSQNSPTKFSEQKDREDGFSKTPPSSALETQVLPTTLDSQESPQPPAVGQATMSGTSPQKGSVTGGMQESLGTKERLRKAREESAAKREAARTAKAFSIPSSGHLSPNLMGVRQTSHPFTEQQQPISPVTRVLPSLTWPVDSQPASSSGRTSPATALAGGPVLEEGHQTLNLAGAFQSPSESHVLAQSSQSRTGTTTPELIPDKLVYQVQEEPERLEVQPVLLSTELPLPMRSSQSVPHTPNTPSRLAIHREASASPKVTLKPINIGNVEFIVPLCMRKRILKQYVDTIEYYLTSVKENITSQTLSDKSTEKLNQLLGRLANVTIHIGLEGGGPGSQESVRSEQEALYAESSSEKFKFLGHLFHLLKDDNLHIALFAQSGHLHDIVELFLKGKKVHYNRPGTYSRSQFGNATGHLRVSILSSSEEGEPEVIRRADLVIALDETFNANHHTVIKLRQSSKDHETLAPVLRLVVYSSVEHLDLCLPRTLEPIDRLRKLISSVWHTQSIVGELQDHEPDTLTCASNVATFVRRGGHSRTWPLPGIRHIENIPVMDSDISLSDAMTDVSTEVGRPHEFALKYWPNKAPATVEAATTGFLGGKRPFDLDYGDSLEVQAKKQKMAQRAHAGQPIEEPRNVENLERLLKEAEDREQRLIRKGAIQEKTIVSFKDGAERRQAAFEDLRDKSSDLHHDKIDLANELLKLKKELEKVRGDRLVLQGERGRLNKEIEDMRQQLLSHPNPIIAEKVRLEMRVRTLEVEDAMKMKKLELAEEQLGYTRQLYQEVSTRTVTLSQELEELQQRVEPMENQLQHERARRKHERENDPRQPLFEEITNLKQELQLREKVIIRKDEEIKEMKRGRGAGVQTRGSSVQPRSPRGGSRGVSPAAGIYPGNAGITVSKGPSGLNRPLNLEG